MYKLDSFHLVAQLRACAIAARCSLFADQAAAILYSRDRVHVATQRGRVGGCLKLAVDFANRLEIPLGGATLFQLFPPMWGEAAIVAREGIGRVVVLEQAVRMAHETYGSEVHAEKAILDAAHVECHTLASVLFPDRATVLTFRGREWAP